MSLFCSCPDWAPNIKKVDGPIALQAVRSGGAYQYDGKPFKFCPWCGRGLVHKCDTCGAITAVGEQTEGHYFYGGCPRPQTIQPPKPPEPETNKCRVCSKPTFGLYCAEHSKGGRP